MATKFLPDVCTFLLRHFDLDVEFLDPDGEDLAVGAGEVTGQRIVGLLATEYREAVRDWVLRRQKLAMQVFVGGPFAGRRHLRACCKGDIVTIHLSQARWAAYVAKDWSGRLWYCGEATSQKKARLVAWDKAKAVLEALE